MGFSDGFSNCGHLELIHVGGNPATQAAFRLLPCVASHVCVLAGRRKRRVYGRGNGDATQGARARCRHLDGLLEAANAQDAIREPIRCVLRHRSILT